MYRSLFFISLIIILAGILLGHFAIQRLGGYAYTFHRMHTIEAWPNYTQRLSQLRMLPIKKVDLLFLGDSHAAQGEWHDWLSEFNVQNQAIPGEGIDGLINFIEPLRLDSARTIIIQIGTNDLLFHSPQAVIQKYEELFQVLANKNTRHLFCTLPGVNNKRRLTGIESAKVHQLNTYLRDKLPEDKLIDLAKALQTKLGVLAYQLTDDGVHLRGEGYAIWSNEIKRTLNRVETY